MTRNTNLTTLAAGALVAVAIAACSGAMAGVPGSTPAPTPTPVAVPATPAPSGSPAGAPSEPAPSQDPADGPGEPTPVITPTPADPGDTPTQPGGSPADGGGDAIPIKVDLDNATGDDVYVDIVDRSGRVVRASSGTPGDGASVPPYQVKVENLDSRTIRLTWSDIPGDNALALLIDETGTGLVLVQPEHDGDSMPFDRILVLGYDAPVSADDLRVTIQDGLDTPG